MIRVFTPPSFLYILLPRTPPIIGDASMINHIVMNPAFLIIHLQSAKNKTTTTNRENPPKRIIDKRAKVDQKVPEEVCLSDGRKIKSKIPPRKSLRANRGGAGVLELLGSS